ncbi:MAG: ABC transporter substrate-binding protein [Alphaproteobacteria bacterium]|nr:ABC transporter substrate-binding protein [Alphaproteobacteria bacterium]
MRALSLVLGLVVFTMGATLSRAQSVETVDKGKLTWGSAATFPPFESMDNGKAVGFDIDVMDAIATKMKVTSAINLMEFKGLIPAVLGNRIDAIASGMYINPERSQVVDFVPYLKVGNQMLVAKGNPLHLSTPQDLCGHKLAAPVGTIYEKNAQALAAECQSGSKPVLTVLSLPSTAAGAFALKEGRAEAIIASTPTVVALIKDSPDAFETAGDVFDNNTLLGIGLPKGKPGLKDAVDTAFKAMVADGTYASLLKKYNFPASSSLF